MIAQLLTRKGAWVKWLTRLTDGKKLKAGTVFELSKDVGEIEKHPDYRLFKYTYNQHRNAKISLGLYVNGKAGGFIIRLKNMRILIVIGTQMHDGWQISEDALQGGEQFLTRRYDETTSEEQAWSDLLNAMKTRLPQDALEWLQSMVDGRFRDAS